MWIRYLIRNSALHYLKYRESSPVRWSCIGKKQIHEDVEVPLVGNNIRTLNVSLDQVSWCGESRISAAWNVQGPSANRAI